MTSWPTAPLIRIIRGTEDEHVVDGAIAARRQYGYYRLLTGSRADYTVFSGARYDSIDEWEDLVAVPVAALKELEQVFRGAEMLSRQASALQAVTSCLPAPGPSPLDVVVAAAKRSDQGGLLSVTEYAASLLRMMPGNAEHLGYTDLLNAAARATEYLRWSGLRSPWDAIASEAASTSLPRAADDRFSTLVERIGGFLVGLNPDDAVTIGAAALAWAAEVLEEDHS